MSAKPQAAIPGLPVKRYRTWTLTDVVNDVWLENFSTGSDRLALLSNSTPSTSFCPAGKKIDTTVPLAP